MNHVYMHCQVLMQNLGMKDDCYKVPMWPMYGLM